MILNRLHVCPFIIETYCKSQFEKFTFSQITFREITHLNSAGPLIHCHNNIGISEIGMR